MRKVWEEVGFAPTTFELDETDKTVDDVHQATKDGAVTSATSFPPTKQLQEPTNRDVEKYDGITVRNIPNSIDEKDIRTFLLNYGMPVDHGQEHVSINRGKRNTCVVIDELSPTDVQNIHKSIHFHLTNQKHFDVPLYCKPIRKMTPKKKDNTLKEDNNIDPSESNFVSNEKVTNDEEDDNPNKTNEKKETNTESKESTRPVIPGLPEEDRLKPKRIKKKKVGKKKKIEEHDESRTLVREDFLISPSSGALKNTNAEWVFSDYGDEENDTDDSNDEFEDSREVQSEIENPPAEQQSDFLTPVNLKSTFARNLQAKTTVTPLLTPTCPNKRAAKSPAAMKDLKKSRGQAQTQSKLPMKK